MCHARGRVSAGEGGMGIFELPSVASIPGVRLRRPARGCRKGDAGQRFPCSRQAIEQSFISGRPAFLDMRLSRGTEIEQRIRLDEGFGGLSAGQETRRRDGNLFLGMKMFPGKIIGRVGDAWGVSR